MLHLMGCSNLGSMFQNYGSWRKIIKDSTLNHLLIGRIWMFNLIFYKLQRKILKLKSCRYHKKYWNQIVAVIISRMYSVQRHIVKTIIYLSGSIYPHFLLLPWLPNKAPLVIVIVMSHDSWVMRKSVFDFYRWKCKIPIFLYLFHHM